MSGDRIRLMGAESSISLPKPFSDASKKPGGLPPIIGQIAAAETDQRAVDILANLAKPFGYDAVMVGLLEGVVGPDPVALSNTWPIDWFERYQREDMFRIDPVAQAVAMRRLPFAWRDMIDSGIGSRTDRERFFKMSAEHGLAEGLAVPIMDTGIFIGGVSLGGKHVDDDPQVIAHLHLASIYVHARVREGAPLPGFDQAAEVRLSARQRDVLRLIADGKSNWEIGVILGIEGRTVRYHLEEVMRKLGTSRRIQTVLKAAVLGLIELDWD